MVLLLIFILWIGFMYFILNDSSTSSSNTSSKSNSTSTHQQSSRTSKTTTQATRTSSPTIHEPVIKANVKEEPPTPEVFSTKLELANLFGDAKALASQVDCYVKKETQLKLDVPIFKVYTKAHALLGVLSLEHYNQLPNALVFDRIYKAQLKKQMNGTVLVDVQFDTTASFEEETLQFKQTSSAIPTKQLNDWLHSLQDTTMSNEEKLDLAYLGPNWRKSAHACANCDDPLYEITTAKDIAIIIGQQLGKARSFSTCLTCESISLDDKTWEAPSEEAYTRQTNYLAASS